MSVLETLSRQLDADAVHRISRQVGADERATGRAVEAALPMLVTALAKNTRSPQGANALAGALDRDHDGSILDDLAGFLGQGRTSPGFDILGHVLGSRQQPAEGAVGKMSGLDSATVGKIFAMLAPIVMGALARQKQERNLGPGDLSDMLGQDRRRLERKAPDTMGMLGGLLDQDGDGDITDDVARMGMDMLGKMFGGKS